MTDVESEESELPADLALRQEAIFNRVLEQGITLAERRQSSQNQAEILMAAHPIWSSSNYILGAVVVEQSSTQVLALQDRVLKNITLVSLLVFIIATAALLTFASRLTLRIGRLRDATEHAITPEGRVRQQRIGPERKAGDEIGDLSRSISSMLQKLAQYTGYLEGLPDTLAHEFSNPLNVVNSSLENLQKEIPETERSKYMQRAENGIIRIRNLLTNLTEAANLEEAMHGETWERFNLVQLVSSYVEGYRTSHPDWKFEIDIQDDLLKINGTPDHIAQMLDKLADNALDFSNPGSPIIFRLQKENNTAVLTVLNEGPELPTKLQDRIFDPMVSAGKKNAKQSQLGLGLYIVRLIASFHQARVSAANRTDVDGVAIRVVFSAAFTAVSPATY